jgi:cysteinyl-tRNA synthetase
LNYSDAHLDDAKGALTRLYTALKQEKSEGRREKGVDWNEPHALRFQAAMDDDFNSAEAIAVLFEFANEVNRHPTAENCSQFKALAGVLGLLQRDPVEFLQSGAPENGLDDAAITAQITARIAAKHAKNYAEADNIRKALLAAGIVLEDSATGTTWRRI